MNNNTSIINLFMNETNDTEKENTINSDDHKTTHNKKNKKKIINYHNNDNDTDYGQEYLDDSYYDLQFDYNNPYHLCKKIKLFHHKVIRQN